MQSAEQAPVVGGYRLDGLIGRGALGEVHRATELATGETVAIKLLRIESAASPAQGKERFIAEATAARRLVHPGIVRVHGAGVERDIGWIAMELLAGCDLSRYTRPARLLPEAVVLRVAERVAQVLAHAHGQGVIHRDVKPANVVVDWSTDRITLTDFGVAHLADGERTRTGLVLGTPAYMAPEQLAGAAASAAGDLYALGAMLFELLAGRLPHDSANLGDLLRRVATEPAPDLRTLRPELPPALPALVATLLAKAPAERGNSAATLAARLRELRLSVEAATQSGAAGPKSRA